MSRKQIIYMIGFMGSGKTTAGRKLASSLGWSFTDLDKKIEEQAGMTIPGIFEGPGEDYFRELEKTLLRSTSGYSMTVVSTGGGAPCYSDNMDFMIETGLTVYLKLTPPQLMGRLKNTSAERPLLKGLDGIALLKYIEQKLEERSVWYERSEIIIDGFNTDIPGLNNLVRIHLDI